MHGMRRLALTGAPASGKSTISELLKLDGFDVLTVEALASENNCIGELDPRDGARPVDVEALNEALDDAWKESPENMTIIDGHLSHLLPVQGVIALRCNPEILQSRLVLRNYAKSKIDSNVEWEFIGGAWNEYAPEIPWVEFDTSEISPGSIVELVRLWISDGFKRNTPDTAIDWIEGGPGDV